MTDDSPSSKKQSQQGELFSRLYLERGAPAQDSSFFRNRLQAYLQKNHYSDYGKISSYLKQEAGLVVPSFANNFGHVFYDFLAFFSSAEIVHVLNAVTLIWRFLYKEYPLTKRAPVPETKHPQAAAWQDFVSRALLEENMAYVLDDMCGVHYHVDEEFERNRVSALRCLDAARYGGVRAAFEAAHRYLDTTPPDTKAAVRSAFEALEVLARMIFPECKNLNKWMVENKLSPLAESTASDKTEADAIKKLFEGIARQVDGLHLYRHGQAATEPTAPSLMLAVYVISTFAAAIRMLAAIDPSSQPSK